MNLAYENVKEVDGLDVSKEGLDSWEAAIKRLVIWRHWYLVLFDVKNWVYVQTSGNWLHLQ